MRTRRSAPRAGLADMHHYGPMPGFASACECCVELAPEALCVYLARAWEVREVSAGKEDVIQTLVRPQKGDMQRGKEEE